jgi:hypothetical protein
MVRRRASFHANQARFLPSKRSDDLCAVQPSFDGHLSGGVDGVNLKPVLGKIETDRGNMHRGWLLSVVAFTDDAGAAGAAHWARQPSCS